MCAVGLVVLAWRGLGWWAGLLAAFILGFCGLVVLASLDDRLRRNVRPRIPPFLRFWP